MARPSLPTRAVRVYSVCMGSNRKSAIAQVAKEVRGGAQPVWSHLDPRLRSNELA